MLLFAGFNYFHTSFIGNDYQEKNINLRISNYMYNRFKELGIPVKITRSTDETIPPKDRTDRILSLYGNDPNMLVISNHINTRDEKGSCC